MALLETLAHEFTAFAAYAERDHSPLYTRLARGAADDAELLALAAQSRPGQPAPNMLLGATHALLLAGTPHPLAAFYASLMPNPRAVGTAATDDPAPLFRAFALEHRAAIAPLLRTRLVQTNEVRRCACLLPALGLVAQAAGGRPLALVEIGTSAGLNLLWDRYHFDYTTEDGASHTLGDSASPLHLTCALRGITPAPLPQTLPAVAWRVGLDLNPIDVRDDDAVGWLRALIWPEHTQRAELLRQAVAVARTAPPRLIAGDALDNLPAVLNEAPRDAALCLFHSFVLNQFSPAARTRLDAQIAAHARQRDIYRVGLDFQMDDQGPVLRLSTYSAGALAVERTLARCQSHGEWIAWGAA